jgi:hypothetical protein
MNPLISARNALKDAVKYALDNEVGPGTQAELWRHFQGVSAICRELDIEEPMIEFNVAGSADLYDPDYNISEGLYNFGAAEPVKLDMQQGGNDYITFS